MGFDQAYFERVPVRLTRVGLKSFLGELQGYLAYTKRHPVGPYSRTMPRLLGWSYGGGAISYERDTPVGCTSRISSSSMSVRTGSRMGPPQKKGSKGRPY